jgi:hypothetical protein
MMLSPAFAQTDIASTSSINSLGLLTGNINCVFHPLDNAYQYSGKDTGTYYCANACMRGHHYLLDDVFLNIVGAKRQLPRSGTSVHSPPPLRDLD